MAPEDKPEDYGDELERQCEKQAKELKLLRAAIVEHHSQKADDRCIEDDDRLYAAAGLPPCDRRVGDKAAMLRNCERFIDNRCQPGGWPTYAELEAELASTRSQVKAVESAAKNVGRMLEELRKTFNNLREILAL